MFEQDIETMVCLIALVVIFIYYIVAYYFENKARLKTLKFLNSILDLEFEHEKVIRYEKI
jgi:uncharacterized membrane protein